MLADGRARADPIDDRRRLCRRLGVVLGGKPARELLVRVHGARAIAQPIEELEELAAPTRSQS
jgi:hypothetical protein